MSVTFLGLLSNGTGRGVSIESLTKVIVRSELIKVHVSKVFRISRGVEVSG